MAEEKDTIIEQVSEKYKKYINPALAELIKFGGYDRVEWEARGAIVTDIDGQEYIDCLGGYGVFITGHGHPKIVQAVKDQLDRMPLSSRILFNKPQADLAELLAQVTPGDLQYSFFGNSGAEAIEGALKLARLYTRKPEIISMLNSFHGKTLGALSASGREVYKEPFKPLLPGFKQVPFGDIDALRQAVTEATAAVILEPIQAEGGVILPPEDYLPQVRQLCDEKNILLIIDEIQTGLGRTGKMWAIDHYGLVPDIMTVGKALGGGVMPIGAFISTEKIWQVMLPNPLLHTSTFGGNPLACSAAIAAIQVIKEEDLPQRAAQLGDYLIARLKELQSKYPQIILDIRGEGLLIGVEFANEDTGLLTISGMAKGNVLVAYALNNPKVMRFEPPAVITKDQIDCVLQVFQEAIKTTIGLLEEVK